jgi:hypothetical protein
MKKSILVDTDVAVDFLRGYGKAVVYLKSHSHEIVLSSIVVAELFAGIRDNEKERLDDMYLTIPGTTYRTRNCQGRWVIKT